MAGKPQVVVDEPHERVHERVAAVDVARKDGVVCARLPGGPGGRRVSRHWRVAAATGAVMALAAELFGLGVEMVTLESTSDYWRIWFYLFEAAIQFGTRRKDGRKPGNSYLRGYLGQAAAGAAGTATFPGERHARIARRRGPAKAQVATARFLLVIIWHLLADREARYHDLGPDHYQQRTDKHKRARNHVSQLEALGYVVNIALAPAA